MAKTLVATESQFQKTVAEYAAAKGWLVHHVRTARTKTGVHMTPVAFSGAGFPDLCMVRDRVVFMELKRAGIRKLRPEQELWRDRLLDAGAEWYCFNGNDWNQIQTVLR